jgi:hypothetical protein
MRALFLLIAIILYLSTGLGFLLGGGSDSKTSWALEARRRKVTKARVESSPPPPLPSTQSTNAALAATSASANKPTVGRVLDVNSFGTADLASLNSRDSKLSPLTGSNQAKIAEFENKSWFDRNIAEYTAPTPTGQEPKLVKLAKNITWGAVLLLVLTEIFVSLKVGGAPFKFGEVKLPEMSIMKIFTGGSGPPEI